MSNVLKRKQQKIIFCSAALVPGRHWTMRQGIHPSEPRQSHIGGSSRISDRVKPAGQGLRELDFDTRGRSKK